jgi:aspartyl protease family protein
MNSDQIANIAFLGLMGAAIAGSYLVSQRGNMTKVAQQTSILGLIFVGMIAAVGIWSDVSKTVTPQQTISAANEVIVPLGNDGHYHLTLEINDIPIDFVVDTGASQVVLTPEDAKRVGIDVENLNYTSQAMTANGVVRTAPVWLDNVELGGIIDENLRAVVNGGEMDGSLLGMTYLNGFDTIQIRDGELVLNR